MFVPDSTLSRIWQALPMFSRSIRPGSQILSAGVICLSMSLSGQASAEDVLYSEDPNDDVVGGEEVSECQWPTSLDLGGCTATLVHPKVITYAAHCNSSWGSVMFGEKRGQGKKVSIQSCKTNPKFTGNNFEDGVDFAYCVLAEEVTDVPITPIAQGCELAAVKPGAEVWIVGFGNTQGGNQGVGQGTKREVQIEINQLTNDGRINVGGGGQGGCHGDSGGPLYIQLPEEVDPQRGWRVIGATSYGDLGCPGETWYSYLPDEDGVPWIEQSSGIDITPCHDSKTGTWEGGPDCKDFASDPSATGRSWDNSCSQELVGNSNCGAVGDDDDDDTSTGDDSSGDDDDDSSSSGDDDDDSSSSDDDDDDSSTGDDDDDDTSTSGDDDDDDTGTNTSGDDDDDDTGTSGDDDDDDTGTSSDDDDDATGDDESSESGSDDDSSDDDDDDDDAGGDGKETGCSTQGSATPLTTLGLLGLLGFMRRRRRNAR
jgi:uncharacterized protein (TIGR03382 family)